MNDILNKYYVYDIEILKNAFTVVFKNEEASHVFTIHEDRNQFRELILFLQQLEREDFFLVGYNNFKFDYVFLDWLLLNYKRYLKTWKSSSNEIIEQLSNLSHDIISENRYPRHKTKIKQIDLYLIHHFDNVNRRTSLKWLEFAMGMDSVEDMPFHYTDSVTLEELEGVVLPYNEHDVDATLAFLIISRDEIIHRQVFGELYGMYFLTDSHTNISKKVFGKILSEKLDISFWDLRNLRTKRDIIPLNDLIFDYISFENEDFNHLLTKFKNLSVRNTKEIKETVEFGGLHFDFGSGGLHSFKKKWLYDRKGRRLKEPVVVPSAYSNTSTHQIVLVDVSSYYPNIAIENKLSPKHLGDDFVEIYADQYAKRLEAKHTKPKTTISKVKDLGLKLGLNSVYGLSNDEYSYFYDLAYTLAITINGQLMLTMLAERIHNAGIKLIQCNTDGIYVFIENDRLDDLREICDWWEELTSLKLDFEYYTKIFQLNVNNYLALRDNGYIKTKGTSFNTKPGWHQDHSAKVVQKAIEAHLVHGINYRDFINNHDNLDDFLLAVKLKKNQNTGYPDSIEERYIEDGEYKIKRYFGVVRYAITHNHHFEKVFGISGNTQALHKGWKCSIANRKSDVSLEDINRIYYIKEAEKIISQFETNQLSLL